jgi:hypothetical protein
VGTRILLQQRNEAAKAAAENVAMEMESDSEEEEGVEAVAPSLPNVAGEKAPGKQQNVCLFC